MCLFSDSPSASDRPSLDDGPEFDEHRGFSFLPAGASERERNVFRE